MDRCTNPCFARVNCTTNLTAYLPKFQFSITNLNAWPRISISLWVLVSSTVAILTSQPWDTAGPSLQSLNMVMSVLTPLLLKGLTGLTLGGFRFYMPWSTPSCPESSLGPWMSPLGAPPASCVSSCHQAGSYHIELLEPAVKACCSPCDLTTSGLYSSCLLQQWLANYGPQTECLFL